mmetsp:Transcript_4390/g.9489  ORF Transcript_4390/g.9489 Transcript_4390/m.9489 type:complete len:543 (-) Transcript_4390:355-1983(-)|eukprot:CAMPEP_0172534876 /NCGR_PEP_ID=MMETSP1067-20121228/7095_1 /TAXON_ID=265564 ORGANISM="Thalassiosira punctigera, Strain Tpunct2005C2" /NCGR_SAMPLE_ID=MMETSP1067 /ASSEMBLY_ACC=CAM_ASM_000444 /LENGTH=542 /DNA_ID=CAMNT_0013319731 /DNA_START=119 /DNA_END=1747 /DNA_ORIENTATION=-
MADVGPRVIRLPDDEDVLAADSSSSGARLALRVRENVALEKLARSLIESKIRPEVLREDVVSDLSSWLRDMLVGPALPLNKQRNFEEDCLNSDELVADAEIFVEAHPGCCPGLVERNRADGAKGRLYPDVDCRLRVREDVLRDRCASMVNSFADKKNVADEALRKRATDDFYLFYRDAITAGGRPTSYNSYTGIEACMGDLKFLRQSEDVVMFGLGLAKTLPEELNFPRSAPPPVHTAIVFAIAMALCLWTLPSLASVDEHATIETFTASVFGEGPLCLPPLGLGIIRILFATICVVTRREKIRNGSEFKIVLLPGSKLRGGYVQMKGWRTQGFYTSWAWNLLGISFALGGTIPMLVAYGREDVLHANPWILRSALISFEVAAPSALLTSFIVTYALWPKAYKDHGASGTKGFKGWVGLLQHNANSAMVLLEVTLMGGLPVKLSHAAFAPLFAGLYQAFLWFMVNRWAPAHGPVFPYFFMDTTLGRRTTIFMVVLLLVIGSFFVLFALLDAGMILIEQGGHGAVPNVCCVVAMSYGLMKFGD